MNALRSVPPLTKLLEEPQILLAPYLQEDKLLRRHRQNVGKCKIDDPSSETGILWPVCPQLHASG